MEVVAQWWDDIEDLIFALPLAWEHLRVWCLHVGLVSALILAALLVSRVLTEWAPTFALTACVSVVIWALGLAVTEIAGRKHALAHTNSASRP